MTDNRNAIIVNSIPYFIFSSDEFEYAIQIINEIGIKGYLEKFKNAGGHNAFKNFIRKPLFEDEMKNFIPQPGISQ
jgi:hypothetical protein